MEPISFFYDFKKGSISLSASKNKLTSLVKRIISAAESEKDTTMLERDLDNMIYRLYDLTYDKVKVIDP